MKKIFILLTSILLLAGCIESVAVIGGGATNGKLVQSSLQTAASYGIKKSTGETPLRHTINYIKKNRTLSKKNSCSSFANKKDSEICLKVEKKLISKHTKIKEFSDKPSKEFALSLQSSINDRSKIKYLD